VTHQALASGTDAILRARRHVRHQLESTLSPSKVTAAELMTSELVSNAVQHAGLLEGDLIGLDIYVEPETVRISVVDAGPGLDPDRPILGGFEGGWGLVLVDRASDRWGINQEHPHSVWFEIDR
jgi:anti-sigma regulatory factor (Ser/Thr protein kinase)